MIVPHCKTVKELLEEYVNLYGKEAWALSTYSSNVSMINNYIIPIIGGDELENGEEKLHFISFLSAVLTIADDTIPQGIGVFKH